jgi:hypothetical protein
MAKASAEILAAIDSLKKDEVLRLRPDPTMSIRGLKTAVGRLAASNNIKVEAWSDGAGEYLYVRKARKIPA